MKSWIDAQLHPLARRILVPPNAITALALAAMAVAALLLARGELAWAGAGILLSGFLDTLDGAVAKARACATAFGALLDRVSDRLADSLIFAAVILGGHVDLRLGLFVLVAVLIASYISACLEAATSSRIGERLSLRAVRLVLLALGCFLDRLPEAIILLGLAGLYASAARMLAAHRMLGR